MTQRTRTNTVVDTLTGTYTRQAFSTVVKHDLIKKHNQYETMTDEVTKGYFKLLKTGALLPLNAASKRSNKVVNRVASHWGYNMIYLGNKVGEVRYTGVSAIGLLGRYPIAFSASNFPSFSEHDVSAMYTDALAAAKTQGMDVLTFYAEFAKTLEMVTGLAGRVLERAHALSKLKKLHTIRDRKQFISAFSDSWLEYRYGWRILAYDIEDIQEVIRKLNEGIYLRFRAKRGNLKQNSVRDLKGQQSQLSFETPNGTFGGSGNSFMNNYVVTETHAARGHAGVLIESLMRATVTVDPLLTAYEMVPYSFVVDWFLNLNKWVAAVSPFLDERIVQAYSRVDYVKTLYAEVAPVPTFAAGPNEVWTPFGSKSSFTAEEVSWERSPLTAGQKQLVLDYDNRFSKLKAADAIALLWGRVRALRKFTSI